MEYNYDLYMYYLNLQLKQNKAWFLSSTLTQSIYHRTRIHTRK